MASSSLWCNPKPISDVDRIATLYTGDDYLFAKMVQAEFWKDPVLEIIFPKMELAGAMLTVHEEFIQGQKVLSVLCDLPRNNLYHKQKWINFYMQNGDTLYDHHKYIHKLQEHLQSIPTTPYLICGRVLCRSFNCEENHESEPHHILSITTNSIYLNDKRIEQPLLIYPYRDQTKSKSKQICQAFEQALTCWLRQRKN